MVMTDVPAATSGDITIYSAERDVNTNFGVMRTTLFARTTGGLMAANVAIPAQNTTMWFNTVGDHFQLPNSDFEEWNTSINEPNHWHGFMTAYGNSTLVAMSQGLVKLASSEDVHNGSAGSHSAVMTAGSTFGIIANGTMTNGRLKAGSMTPADTANHAEMDKAKTNLDPNGDLFYMPLYAKPDKFNVWLKYNQGSTTPNPEPKANVSVKTFDGTYYQEPVDKVYTNLSGSIVGGQIPAGDWTFYSFPFDYDSYAANNADTEAIFVTFSTNGNPGQGSKNDKLFVDDMELVYLAEMTDLRYQGTTIDGWDPEETEYAIEMSGEPNLDDFSADVTGASAVVTKSLEQLADGSYRIAICAVSGDLQTATAYIINATVATSGLKGDVNGDGLINIGDLSVLITYLLNGIGNINEYNADMNSDNNINLGDLTMLISYLLNN